MWLDTVAMPFTPNNQTYSINKHAIRHLPGVAMTASRPVPSTSSLNCWPHPPVESSWIMALLTPLIPYSKNINYIMW